ncbi:type II toxin-antitoxin system prevent-host-death family antitoxin [Aquiluna borgnonia]|uniref:Antitoxin n=1 Tax=Aquiluna borgnonia TaxID=2499157 RepID=A0A7D4UMA6_9MICO|nr:type II toxin-antitoxin system prevent-host-death family antitoxin [Aquiluna borgnonia]QKJ25818.1 type II toxin-antitoxin system prevent-host-death family antitoxin [Aquiluna borgnonia]
MVVTVNMHEAKTNFSKLAKLVEQGEEVVVARNGVEIMKLVPVQAQRESPRDFTKLKGLIGPISNRQWEELDQAFLDSIEYSEWNG